MNILSKTMICAAVLLATTSATFAGNINQREHTQVQRIYGGVFTHKLTPAEFIKLAKAQAEVRRLEALARRNGTISPLERFALNQALNYQSVLIHQYKH